MKSRIDCASSITPILLLVCGLCIVEFSLMPWYFPPTDGWWVSYSWLMDNGIKIYKDAFLALPPLHLIIINKIAHITNYNFLEIRIFGIVGSVASSVFVYMWLEKITTRLGALFGSFVSALMVINANRAYVLADYHTTIVIFEALALYFTASFVGAAKYEPKNYEKKIYFPVEYLSLFMVGMFSGCLLLLKQNIGVFFPFAIGISLAFIFRQSGASIYTLLRLGLFYFVAVVVPSAIYTGFCGFEWLNVYVGNDSKGGVFTVLFRWIIEKRLRYTVFAALAFLIIYIDTNEIIKFVKKNILKTAPDWIDTSIAYGIKFISPVFVVLLFRMSLSEIFDSLVLSWILAQPFKVFFNPGFYTCGWFHKFGWFPLLVLVYCGTQTAGFNIQSMHLAIALLISIAVNNFLKSRLSKVIVLGPASLVVIISLFFIIYKLCNPLYDWWGLKQSNFFESKYKLSNSMLSGFSVDKVTSQFYGIIEDYKPKITLSDKVFAYPSIPIVYLLLGKLPPIKYNVLWFDVSSANSAPGILNALNEDLPKYIFWLKPPDFVYQGHQILRGRQSLMLYIDKWLLDNYLNGTYTVDNGIPIPVTNFSPDAVGDYGPLSVEYINPKAYTVGKNYLLDGIESVDFRATCKDIQCNRFVVDFSDYEFFKKNWIKFGLPVRSNEFYFFIVMKRALEGSYE